MSSKLKNFLIVLLFSLLVFTFITNVSACNYRATITGNHLDFAITSDLDKLDLVQYIRQSGSALVIGMSGPDVGTPWTYFNDPYCNVYVDYPVGCQQIRNEVQPGVLGTGAFWQWSLNGYPPYHVLPGGIWKMDFDSPPTYESLGIEYGTTGGGDAWKWCTLTGDVTLPTLTPSTTPTPTPTPIPVTKVFLIPGMGASWNVDALINCKNADYSGDWTLAPYAKNIYNPLSSALNSRQLEYSSLLLRLEAGHQK